MRICNKQSCGVKTEGLELVLNQLAASIRRWKGLKGIPDWVREGALDHERGLENLREIYRELLQDAVRDAREENADEGPEEDHPIQSHDELQGKFKSFRTKGIYSCYGSTNIDCSKWCQNLTVLEFMEILCPSLAHHTTFRA